MQAVLDRPQADALAAAPELTRSEASTSPAAFLDDVLSRLSQGRRLLETIDRVFYDDVIERSNRSDDHRFSEEVDRLGALLEILQREMTALNEMVTGSYGRFVAGRAMVGPLGTYASRMRAQRFEEAMSAYNAATEAVVEAKGDEAIDKAADLASDALAKLVATPAFSVADVKRKLVVIVGEYGDITNNALSEVLKDVERIETLDRICGEA